MRVGILSLLLLPACDFEDLFHDDDDLEDELLGEVEEDLEYYQEWAKAPGIEGVVEDVSGFHGPYIQIWYNDVALGSLDEPVDDAAAVKESYDDPYGLVLNGLTSMRYDDDYGWFYAEVEIDTGEFEETGRVGECIECHEENGGDGFLAPTVH